MAEDMITTYLEDLDEILSELNEGKEDSSALVQEAEDILDQLKISALSLQDKDRKGEVQSKVILYRMKLDDLKRSALLGDDDGLDVPMGSVQRSQQSLEVLQASHRQLLETEEVGNGIIQNLDQQKETILHTQGNLQEINSEANHSNKLLTKMSKWWR